MIDGIGTTTSLDGGEIEFTSPPYDSMEEFKVQTPIFLRNWEADSAWKT